MAILVFDADCGFCTKCATWLEAHSVDDVVCIASHLVDHDFVGVSQLEFNQAAYWFEFSHEPAPQALRTQRDWSKLFSLSLQTNPKEAPSDTTSGSATPNHTTSGDTGPSHSTSGNKSPSHTTSGSTRSTNYSPQPSNANELITLSASGAEAIALALCRCALPYQLVGRVIRLPLVRSVAELLYRLIAKNRHKLPGSDGSCSIT